MAQILNQDFTAGIPGGFATLRSQAGTATATANGTYNSVDLSNATAGQNIWDITSLGLMSTGEMEIDLELVADLSGTSNLRHAGIWAVSGAAAVSNGVRCAHSLYTPTDLGSDDWSCNPWTGATSWGGNGTAPGTRRTPTFPFTTVGDRRILNFRWDMTPVTAGITKLTGEFRVDGNLVSVVPTVFASLRPGIFFYQSTVRLRTVKVWDAPQAALASLGAKGGAAAVGERSCAPPEQMVAGSKPQNIFRGLTIGKRNPYHGGNGMISGTTKTAGTPNVPVSRRVRLFRERDHVIMGEVWSDAATGYYEFRNLDINVVYTVITYDYGHNYRAVVADNITPEAMP